jgi:hypothetical protein
LGVPGLPAGALLSARASRGSNFEFQGFPRKHFGVLGLPAEALLTSRASHGSTFKFQGSRGSTFEFRCKASRGSTFEFRGFRRKPFRVPGLPADALVSSRKSRCQIVEINGFPALHAKTSPECRLLIFLGSSGPRALWHKSRYQID